MKKMVVFSAIASLMLMGTMAWAGSKNVTFQWTQQIPSPNNLKEWHIYQASTAGGENQGGTPIATIPFSQVQSQYSYSMAINFPDGAKTTYYFKMDVMTTGNVKSDLSNEASATVDLTIPPVPGGFTVTVQ